jgi:hypothetical protein
VTERAAAEFLEPIKMFAEPEIARHGPGQRILSEELTATDTAARRYVIVHGATLAAKHFCLADGRIAVGAAEKLASDSVDPLVPTAVIVGRVCSLTAVLLATMHDP